LRGAKSVSQNDGFGMEDTTMRREGRRERGREGKWRKGGRRGREGQPYEGGEGGKEGGLDLPCHDATFDVPPGTTAAPRRAPRGF